MQAQPPIRRPYGLHLRERICFLYFSSGWTCADIAAVHGGHPCTKTVERIVRDFRAHGAVRVPQGWKGALRSHRKHDAVAAQLLVSIVQDDAQV